MKAMSMKMKKMAMKKSIIAKGKRAKSAVFRGSKAKTVGGLKKTDLKKNKAGKVVSIKASNAAKKKKNFKKFAAWGVAVKKARAKLGLKKFVPVKKGTALYNMVKSLL